MTRFMTRALHIAPETFDAETREFEAVASTGADRILPDTQRGSYIERLDLSAVDPAALVGKPVLDGHRQSGSENVVGVIVAARREGSDIVVRVRLSAAPDVESVRTKIAEGVLTDVSIGYGVKKRTQSVENGKRVVTIQPEIVELSVVPIGADASAKIRSLPSMTIETEDQPGTAANDNAVQTRAAIRKIAASAKLSPEWADEQIDSGVDVVAVRAAAFEAMTTAKTPAISTHTANPANDDPAIILRRRTDALNARVNGTAPADDARQYFADGLVDHARAMLTGHGISTVGMDREQILTRAMHTTSDFPQLLTGVGNRTLMPAYQAAESPLKRLARQALHNDFRTASRLKLGETGALGKVSESGEIKHTTRGEAAEGYALDTYGSLFSLSRKAIINDDLGAFRDWGIAAGRAAAETEANLLFALLTQSSGAGPIMGEDGKRLFHADHGNLAGSGATPGVDSLTEARKALRFMKGLDGKTPIAATPKFLLVGPELETIGEATLAAITAATTDDVNPFGGKLELLVEPRMTGDDWYIFTDPAQLAVLEYAYLSSAQGPQMASREGWDVLGMEFRVVLDFGCGAIDYRGAFRNPGA